jgi:hypothetical protein
MQTTDRSAEYEETVIDIMRKLPPKRAAEIVDFARFLESQVEKHDDLLSEETEEEIHTSEEMWDELLSRPEAKRLLRQMAREALEDYHAGRTTGITITEDGQLAPE